MGKTSLVVTYPPHSETRQEQMEEGMEVQEVEQKEEDSVDMASLSPEGQNERLLLRWMRSMLTTQLTGFDPKTMWTNDVVEACKKFLASGREDGTLFVWIAEHHGTPVAVTDTRLMKQSQTTGVEDLVLHFMKFCDKTFKLTEENIEDLVTCKTLALGDNMQSLVYEMKLNTLPQFLKDKEWPENIKKDLLEQSHKFMAQLTEIVSKRYKTTELYIPVDNLSEHLTGNEQKERNHRLKEVLSHWTKQIRDLINNQTNQIDSDNSGPLEEITNWTLRKDNLINIKSQLEKPDLKRILDILDKADPKNLKNFNELVKSITGGAEEAEDNLKYLKSLSEPCKEMAKSTPSQIVSILPRILMCVRLIKENSTHYRSNDKIIGLLRKISNEIINRCKSNIDVDDMLFGDVHKCIRDLNEATNCGLAWKNIYNETVEAIKKRDKTAWDFNSDNIFTQIDAFVQRCNELVEICEGQIQFARKGRKIDLPKFSGSKGPEIVSVLDVIKSSYEKHLEKIHGSDKDKILDINYTKWHDNYSAFKNATKSLEMNYNNLINSSFENLNKLSQAVEYIEAFDDLARKVTIKNQVHKQMAKVNEIFLKELQTADQLSKKPFALPYNHGKSSGQAIWIRSLLHRIEKLKKQYDSLTFIKNVDKHSVQVKYDAVERSLTLSMRECFEKFRYKKDKEIDIYEEIIHTWENNKILVNSDSDEQVRMQNQQQIHPDTKIKSTNPVMLEAKAAGKGHIEANFNKDLYRVLIEVPAFKKLLKDNIGNFGTKTEEYVNAKREILRVVREAVMIAVRDYNLIHDLMSPKEKRLFRDHLIKLSEHKDKGRRSIPWNPVVDGFVKKMRNMCNEIYISLMQYKHSDAVIHDKISEISRYNKFIVFDVKEPCEIDTFMSKQQSNNEQVAHRIISTFSEIKKILANTFEDFVDKNSAIHIEWFEHVRTIDKKIEDELRKAVRTSFQEFYKAIKGDERSKTNPAQLLKVYIILKQAKDEYEAAFDPKKEDIKEKITLVLNRAVDVTSKFKHIEADLLDIRSRRVQELKEKQEEDKKRGIKNDNAPDLNPDNSFLRNPKELKEMQSFKEVISSDVTPIINEINLTLDRQMKQMNEHLDPWKADQFRSIWTTAKKEFYKKYLSNMDVSNYKEQIEKFETVQSKIKNDYHVTDNLCIKIDSRKIKQDISQECSVAQKKLLTEIKTNALSKLNEHYNKFNLVSKELKEDPEDLVRLQEAIQKWNQFSEDRGEIEFNISVLEAVFELLDSNLEYLPPEDNKRRQGLPEAAEEFKRQLDRMKERNTEKFNQLQRNFQEKLTQLKYDIKENKDNFSKTAPFNNEEGGVEGAFKKLETFMDQIETFKQRITEMSFGFELFKLTYVAVPELDQVETEIRNLKMIWNKKKEWNETWNQLKQTKFTMIDTTEVRETCKRFHSDIDSFEKHIREWGVSKDLKMEIQKIIDNMPIIDILREPCIRKRHWETTIRLVSNEGFDHEQAYFTMEKFVELGFTAVLDKIMETADTAQAQYTVEKTIGKIVQDWGELKIDQVPMLNSPDIMIVKKDSVNTISNKLEEDMVILASLKTNIAALQFEKDINDWDEALNKIMEALEILYTVQRKFEYVSNIFNNIQSEQAQLQGDHTNFMTQKGAFKRYMDAIHNNPNAKASLTMEKFKLDFENIGRELDKIQYALRNLLKKRRTVFARFYFLSDEDMFELLGNAKNPVVINKHLKKMYEGVKQLALGEDKIVEKQRIGRFKAMISPDGEVVDFVELIDINGDLTKMMSEIEKQTKDSLKHFLKNTTNALETATFGKGSAGGSNLENFIKDTPGQIILLLIQIDWTKKCQDAIERVRLALEKGDRGDKETREANKTKKNPMKEEWRDIKQRYEDYMVHIPKLMLTVDNSIMKLKINAMIILLVHNRDIINELCDRITSTSSFDWNKQLRFYKGTEEGTLDNLSVEIKQGNAKFFHGWEYQGNNGRLIVTALTDRCYLTLTTAMDLRRGGCPQGPAGTGKTETVKDLGKNMGRFVFVFNCSEGLDVKSLRSMFEGFAKTGSWSCFDEFNRIEIEVLSVVAIYIKSILDALSKVTSGEFTPLSLDDVEILLNINCSLFITMNPGYSGRTELPDNLKALFRPISMMVPDSQMICNITLKSEGFTSSENLARKIKNLYDLMNQQLSKQDHYDFGLRAIKSVLDLAGKIKRRSTQKQAKPVKGKGAPDQGAADKPTNADGENREETEILIKAIRDMNDPKLVAEDEPLFRSLLTDLFRNSRMEIKKDRDLFLKINDVLVEQMMGNSDYVINKVIQLFDSKLTRHGNMLVGKTLSGKTNTYKVLAKAMNSLNATKPDIFNKVSLYHLNPKSIDMLELYGYYDSSEDKSHIGVFSYLMETLCNKSDTPEQKWILFDGPIDTKWIESMNSLLDDNKILTLLDGNRINLHPLVSLIFETEDLKQASPATVSRCGMIYMDVQMLDWDNLRLRWLLQKEKMGFDDESLDIIEDLFDKWVTPILDKKKKGLLQDAIPIQENQSIQSLLKLLDTFLVKENGLNFELRQTDEMFWIKFEKWFTYCVIWSLGASIHEDYRKAFDTTVRGIEDMFPLSQTVYDCYINVEKCEFVKWEDRLTIAPNTWKPKEGNIPRHKLLVDTVDTMRSRYLIENDLKNHIPLLIVGVTGTGKTAIMNSFLGELSDNEYSYNIINLSAQTSSKKLQQIVESKLNTSAKRKYRPPLGKKGVVFIDDFNMPKPDPFGAQPPLELIRQYLDFGGWYDRANLDLFVEIEKTDLLCAMAPPGGGRNTISNRLASKFHFINLTLPSNQQMKRIYTSILNFTTLGFESDEIRVHIDKVVDIIIECFQMIGVDERFRPTPQKSHYLFNLRDMSRIVQGMGMVDKDSCDNQNTFLKLLVHEHFRVYRDRMINKNDKDSFRKVLDGLLSTHFQTSIGTVLREGQDEVDLSDELIFVDFLDAGKAYAEVKNRAQLQQEVEKKLAEYNRRSKLSIDVVFFSDALKNLCRIHRIIRMSNGHALLIGEGGSGRHSLSRMAAYIAEYNEFQIKIIKNYSGKNFQADVKTLFQKIVEKNESFNFIFSDNEITTESIIEDVNSMLSIGEIPNLYQKKEGKDEFAPIRDKLKGNRKETDEKLYDQFINKIQEKLHICFCIGQSGTSLRTLARKYPGLVNNTTQIWFEDWPFDALCQVATHYLKEYVEVELPPPEPKEDGEEEQEDLPPEDENEEEAKIRLDKIAFEKAEKERLIKEELKKEKVHAMSIYFSSVHSSVKEESARLYQEFRRVNFVTPKNFIDFVKEFMSYNTKKKIEVSNQLNIYTIGLNKLGEAQHNTAKIKETIILKNEEQKSVKKRLDDIIKKLAVEEKNVARDKEKVMLESQKVQGEEEAARLLEKNCEDQLSKIQPMLDAADAKVKELESEKGKFAEIKSSAKTGNPPVVMDILKAIMIIMGEPPTSEAIQKSLANNFLNRMMKIDKEQLANERARFDRFEEMTKNIPPDLTKISLAAETMRNYISSLATYVKAVKEVQPIREDINRLKKKIKDLRATLENNQYKLNQAIAKETQLKIEKDENQAALEKVDRELSVLESRKERAEELVKGLESSKDSWTKSQLKFSVEIKTVEGNAMLTVAFLNYFGPFSSEFRARLKTNMVSELAKSKILYSNEWDFINYMGDEMELVTWNFKGLPSDQFSSENGVIVMNTNRWPLLIDPQNQGNKWIKELLNDKSYNELPFSVTNPQDPNFLKTINVSVTNGFIVLLENIDETIDPSLEAILNKNIKVVEGRDTLEGTIPYNRNFRFFLTTRLSNPEYKAEISTKVTIVNFTVREKGLEEQLLSELIKIVNSKLEETRVKSIEDKSRDEKKLKESESYILRKLQESNTDMVDDEELIQTLKTSSETEAVIIQNINVNKQSLEKNRVSRDNYRPIGYIGSVLYFTIYNLNIIDRMYQFSLESFVELFKRVVSTKKDDKTFGAATEVIKEKIEAIDEGLRKEVYDYACRGIFEKDKLLLSLQMCVNLAEYDEKNKKEKSEEDEKKPKGRKGKKAAADADKEGEGAEVKEVEYYKEYFKAEWSFFLKGGVVISRDNQMSNPDASWISQNMWDNITEMDALPNFQGISGSFTHTNKDWKRFFTSDQPETEPLPSDWSTKIKGFSLLVLLRAIRPDRVPFAAMNFVKVELGESFIQPPPFNIQKIYESLNKHTPCLFILSPGADPLSYLDNLAKEKNATINQMVLSERISAENLKEKMHKLRVSNGEWIFLANVHLSVEGLKNLELVLDDIRKPSDYAPPTKKGYDKGEKYSPDFRIFMTANPSKNMPISFLQKCMKITTEPPKGIRANMLKLYNNLVKDTFDPDDCKEIDKYSKLLFGLAWFHSLVIERKKFRTLGWNVMYDFNDTDFMFSDKLIRKMVDIPMAKGSNGTVQWDAIRTIIADINYGGRVTDQWDRRLLNQYATELFVEELFQKDKPYILSQYKSDSEYKVPKDIVDPTLPSIGADKAGPLVRQTGMNQFCKDFIENNFPLIEVPGIFGAHGNAEVTSQKAEASILLESLLSLQPRDTAADNKSREEAIISLVQGYRDKLPEEIDYYAAREKNLKYGDDNPLVTVLLQEISRYNSLLMIVKTTFNELISGLKGQTLISEQMELVLQNILDNKIPSQFKNTYLSIKSFVSWIDDLVQRVNQMRNWAFKGTPLVFWLGGFSYPTGFTTALKQKYVRSNQNGISIENVKWEFTPVKMEIAQPPREGAYIDGMYLEGAKWNSAVPPNPDFIDEETSMNLVCKMPVIHMKPIDKPRSKFKTYQAPVYYYPIREGTRENPSFVFDMALIMAAEMEESFFIKRGTAVLLNLGD